MNVFRRVGSWWLGSIRWQMVVIFIAVSVVPMLLLTDIATRAVSTTFKNNVEQWLFQASQFFLSELFDERRETMQVATNLADSGALNPILLDRSHELPPAVAQIVDALGYDLVAIFDDKNNIIYTSQPFDSITPAPFVDGHKIYIYRNRGKPTLMEAGSSDFVFQGHTYRLLIGNLIDESSIDNIEAMKSLAIRLYYRIDGTFVQVYSSQPQVVTPLPPSIVRALSLADRKSGYVADDTSGDGNGFAIFAPLLTSGQLVAVVACNLSSNTDLTHWLTRSRLFVGIFAFGMLLSVVVGVLLSDFLTRPVVRLVRGVNAIADGDYSQRVAVRRGDELGQLAAAFNSMAQRLEGLRKMELKLRRRERLTTLGEVAAGLAHEVRNPLGIIKTSAELLEKSSSLTDIEARRLGYIVDESRRIDQLIRNFLVFAKPPRQVVRRQPIEVINHVVGICQSEIDRRGVSVCVTDDSAGATVRLDYDQMIEACLNLTLNALQAMDEVKVAVGAEHHPWSPELDIRITAGDDEVRITFTDNGPGIPAQFLDRIFDPFVTTKTSGTGLGLARVFAVAEGHGGWVEVRNAETGGAIFDLVIPRADRESSDEPSNPDR